MDRELSNLIDNALAWREAMAARLSSAEVSGAAVAIQYKLAELDGLLALLTRTTTRH